MIRLIFVLMAISATLIASCDKEVIDEIAPTVMFQSLDGNAIPNNAIDIELGSEAVFSIFINDEANIRDIRYLLSVNDGESAVIDQPGYLEQVESSPIHKVMIADIPISSPEYQVGDLITIQVMVADPSGNATVEGLMINVI